MGVARRLPRLAGESDAEWLTRQRLENLRAANAQRRRMKILRESARLGIIDPWQLLRGDLPDYEPVVARMRAEHALRLVRGIGKVRAGDVLDLAHVKPTTKLGRLSPRRRAELVRIAEESLITYGDL